MNPHKLLRVSIPFALGVTLTVLFWLALSPRETATATRPDLDPASPQRSTDYLPADLTWINLLKTLHAKNAAPDLALTLNVNLNTNHIAGHTPLGSSITISVTRGETLVAQAVTTPVPNLPSFFYQTYLNWNEYPFGFQPGDLIWLEQADTIVTMTVPTLTVQAFSPNDTILGVGPENASLLVHLLPYADPTTFYTQTTTTDAEGTYQLDWGNSPGVEPADRGFVVYSPAANQMVFNFFLAPLLRAQLNGTEISGYATPYAGAVYITVKDTGGEPLGYIFSYPAEDGSFFESDYYHVSELINFQPGYQIFVSTSQGQTFSMTVQPLTIALDTENGEISGATNSSSPVQVLRLDGPLVENPYINLWELPPDEFHEGTTNTNGEFILPVSLQPANFGAVTVTTPDDFLTYVRFNMPFIRVFQQAPYQPLLVGQVNQFNTQVDIAIQGPSGYLKDIFSADTGSVGFFVGDHNSTSINSIAAGDVITISNANGIETSMNVPTITVETDWEEDTISGQAPPGSLLTIYLFEEQISKTLVVTTTAEGMYQGDFAAQGGFSDQVGGFVVLPFQGNELVRYFSGRIHCSPIPTEINIYGKRIKFIASDSCTGAFFRLLNPQGQEKYTTYLPEGTWDFDIYIFDGDSKSPILILPEDIIEIRTDSEVVTYPVPQLSANLIPGSQQIFGTGPSNTPIQIAVNRERLSDTENYSITTDTQGQFVLTLPSAPTFTAGDQINLKVEEDYPQYRFSTAIPLLQAMFNEQELQGKLTAFTAFEITWQSVDGLILHTYGESYEQGEFFVNWPSWPFTPPITITNQPGDQFTLIYTNVLSSQSEILTFTLSDLTGYFDKNTATISGNAPINSPIMVEIYPNGENHPTKAYITSTAVGTYSISFPDVSPIYTAKGVVTHFNPDGFETQVSFATTHWDLDLGESCIQGSADAPGTNISIHIQSANNTLSETVSTYASIYNGWFDACFLTQTVQSGAHLVLETNYSTNNYTVPEIYASYDPQRQVIEGMAIPNTNVFLYIQNGDSYPIVSRQTIAQPDGSFGLDVSDLSLVINSWASISMNDSAGNQLRLEFYIRGHTLFLPAINRPTE